MAKFLVFLRAFDVGIVLGIITLVAAFVIGLSPACSDAIQEVASSAGDHIRAFFSPAPIPVPPDQPDVLLVSPREADQLDVMATLEPRGVHVRIAADAEAAIEDIASVKTEVGMLIVDDRVPGHDAVVREAHMKFPKIEVYELENTRQPLVLTAKLLDYASW